MNDDMARLLVDLDLLAGDAVFDLSDGTGASAIAAARGGIQDHFDAEVDADGVPWPELAESTLAEKRRLWPGKPILVRTGELRAGIAGEATIAPDVAIYTFGTNDINRAEADYAEQGDPLANRPPRKFVDLNADSTQVVDGIFDRQFETKGPQ